MATRPVSGPSDVPPGLTIHHHGAVIGVLGSCHELRLADGRSLLVDCGLFQGAERSAAGASMERIKVEFPVDGLDIKLQPAGSGDPGIRHFRRLRRAG